MPVRRQFANVGAVVSHYAAFYMMNLLINRKECCTDVILSASKPPGNWNLRVFPYLSIRNAGLGAVR
jgi:hypothetical protein